MPQVNFSCSFGSWFVRFLTWGAIVAAFAMSLQALTACDLVEGRTVFYTKAEADQGIYDDPCDPDPCEFGEVCLIIVRNGENDFLCETPETNTPTETPTEAEDPNYDPSRADPNVFQDEFFTLGVFKARDVAQGNVYGGECIDYSNDVTDFWLDDGTAEGAARFFGTLAATLGGVAMFGFLALAAMGGPTPGKVYVWALGGVLVVAATCQVFIFVLFASKHCDAEFWQGYTSVEDLVERTAVATSCEMGDGGWYALIALFLYIFAALLALTKWLDPQYKLCLMEWTKDYSQDGGRYETNRTWVPHHGGGGSTAASTSAKSHVKAVPSFSGTMPRPPPNGMLPPVPEQQQHVLNVVRPAMDTTEEYDEEDERTPFTGPGPDNDDTSV